MILSWHWLLIKISSPRNSSAHLGQPSDLRNSTWWSSAWITWKCFLVPWQPECVHIWVAMEPPSAGWWMSLDSNTTPCNHSARKSTPQSRRYEPQYGQSRSALSIRCVPGGECRAGVCPPLTHLQFWLKCGLLKGRLGCHISSSEAISKNKWFQQQCQNTMLQARALGLEPKRKKHWSSDGNHEDWVCYATLQHWY